MQVSSDIKTSLPVVELNSEIAWDEHLARWVSRLFSPPLLGFIGFFLIVMSIGTLDAWLWAGFYLVLGILFPIFYIIWNMRTGQISDFHMRIREQRIRPMFFLLACSLAAWLSMWVGSAPWLLTLIAGGSVFLCAFMFLVTLRWKISGHSVAVASLTVFLSAAFGNLAFLSLLTIPLVAWARVRLNRHSLPQTIAGILTGVIFVLILFYLVSQQCQGNGFI
jgi:membrane-associated phospholipid phosphatase